MATVTIVFEDEDNGVVDINATFDPPMPEDPDKNATPAQKDAGYVLLALRDSDETTESTITDVDGVTHNF